MPAVHKDRIGHRTPSSAVVLVELVIMTIATYVPPCIHASLVWPALNRHARRGPESELGTYPVRPGWPRHFPLKARSGPRPEQNERTTGRTAWQVRPGMAARFVEPGPRRLDELGWAGQSSPDVRYPYVRQDIYGFHRGTPQKHQRRVGATTLLGWSFRSDPSPFRTATAPLSVRSALGPDEGPCTTFARSHARTLARSHARTYALLVFSSWIDEARS
ncbi:uncharacterized protein PSFLO_05342 [Pseudozyma flocculosa]|uniref:Uncharacterized protein n=1 Tax=Pseudozyma flocculosa TaxID=84751 RepID=A0A5C3F912_9BASI|nr:uncharacterized protein PSFLO_05342 [Pseudozyma flocculosa]